MKKNTGKTILGSVAFIALIVYICMQKMIRDNEAEMARKRQEVNDTIQSEEFQQQVTGLQQSQQELGEQIGAMLSENFAGTEDGTDEGTDTPEEPGSSDEKADKLDVKSVTYLVYPGGVNQVIMYVITSDLNVEKYTVNGPDKNYDYLGGELPSEDTYEAESFEISESDWNDIVNALTEENFMELDEDLSTKEEIDDGSSYYIKVETADGTNTSGGYMAGYDKDAASKQFDEVKEVISNTVK